jgi:hypothetical protein
LRGGRLFEFASGGVVGLFLRVVEVGFGSGAEPAFHLPLGGAALGFWLALASAAGFAGGLAAAGWREGSGAGAASVSAKRLGGGAAGHCGSPPSRSVSAARGLGRCGLMRRCSRRLA